MEQSHRCAVELKSQSQKNPYCVISLIWSSIINKMKYSDRNGEGLPVGSNQGMRTAESAMD